MKPGDEPSRRAGAAGSGPPDTVPAGRSAAGRRRRLDRHRATEAPAHPPGPVGIPATRRPGDRWTSRTTTRRSGVPRTASQADIKKAFRKLAREHHPDKKPGDKAAEARFKAVNEANAVLSDPDKRKKYDRLGKDWEAYSPGRRRPGRRRSAVRRPAAVRLRTRRRRSGQGGNVRYEFRTAGGAPGDFSDFFRAFFGGDAVRRPPAGPVPAAAGGPTGGPSFDDILAEMGLNQPARPAARRGRRVRTRRAGPAPRDGRGDRRDQPRGGLPRHDPAGRDRRPAARRDDPARRRRRARRSSCPARVRAAATSSSRSGSGRTRSSPARAPTSSASCRSPSPRRSSAPRCRSTTLKGKVLLRIPAGTQNGHRFRLKGQGMPQLRGEGDGDLYARARVVLPPKLDDEAGEAARAFLDAVDQPDPAGDELIPATDRPATAEPELPTRRPTMQARPLHPEGPGGDRRCPAHGGEPRIPRPRRRAPPRGAGRAR